jgi:hypothetical protein
MRNTFATVFAGSVLAALISFQAQALPMAPAQAGAQASVILVEGGCGPGFHRGEFGRCRPNEREVIVAPVPGVVVVEPRGRICPPGTHLGPEGRACRPNY